VNIIPVDSDYCRKDVSRIYCSDTGIKKRFMRKRCSENPTVNKPRASRNEYRERVYSTFDILSTFSRFQSHEKSLWIRVRDHDIRSRLRELSLMSPIARETASGSSLPYFLLRLCLIALVLVPQTRGTSRSRFCVQPHPLRELPEKEENQQNRSENRLIHRLATRYLADIVTAKTRATFGSVRETRSGAFPGDIGAHRRRNGRARYLRARRAS